MKDQDWIPICGAKLLYVKPPKMIGTDAVESEPSDLRGAGVVSFGVTFDPGSVKHLFRDCQAVELQIGESRYTAKLESAERISDEEVSVTLADVREVK